MKFTTDQHRAISSFDRNVIVVAGAGSGKTAVLVQRFLALLDAHPDWPLNALVAITFTEKAAGEMRDRVRQALEQRLANATSDDARALWAARVGAMDSARIDTFHSLCAAILRANAAEAGVDPGFGILDDIDARMLLDNVFDDALRALVAERDPVARLFSEYPAASIRDTVIRFVAHEFPSQLEDPFAVWLGQWQHDARAMLDDFLMTDAATCRKWQPASGVWPTGNDKLLNLWRTVHAALDALDAVDDPASALVPLNIIKGLTLTVGSAAVWGNAEALAEAKAPLAALRARADALLSLLSAPPSGLDQRAAELLPLWLALLHRVQALYRAAK